MQYQARGEGLLCFSMAEFLMNDDEQLLIVTYNLFFASPLHTQKQSGSQMNWKSSSSFQFIFGYIAAQLSTVKYGVFYNEPKRPEVNSIQSVV